jgi:hypothetical protein
VAVAKRIESVYEFSFLAHATMEPMNITVRLESGRFEIWSPTNSYDALRMPDVPKLDLPLSENYSKAQARRASPAMTP